MAGKKKKPASNPARGFATSSVESKTRVVKEPEVVQRKANGNTTLSDASYDIASAEFQAPGKDDDGATQPRELHQLSPEELEAQLELSELQNTVTRLGPIARKEATRHYQRLQSERRVLRPQSEYLHVSEWLPLEVIDQITDLLDSEPTNLPLPTKSGVPTTSDDDLLRLWKLHLVLRDLGVADNDIFQALSNVLACSRSQESSSTTLWGLSAVLQWLTVRRDDAVLTDYDAVARSNTQAPESEDLLAKELVSNDKSDKKKFIKKLQTSAATTTIDGQGLPRPNLVEVEDLTVSDADSDLDPDEMLSLYLNTKSRLFERDPSLVGEAAVRGTVTRPSGTLPTPGEQLLQQRLRDIQSDVLFDQKTADAHWRDRRQKALVERQQRQRAGLTDIKQPTTVKTTQLRDNNLSVAEEAEAMAKELLETVDDDDADMLEGMGGMFDIPVEQGIAEISGSDQQGILVRNFGKLSGMSPRKILEDACKSRDSGAAVRTRLVSATTYNSRHQVVVSWSKAQDIDTNVDIAGITARSSARTTVVEMITVAASDTVQSEGCACTAMLFYLFSHSAKDEKLALRLPPAMRDLWQEFAAARQEVFDATDRELVKRLRQIIQNQHESSEEEDVVLTSGFRDRSKATSGVSTPNPDSQRPTAPIDDQSLIDLWQRKSSTPAYRRMLQARMNLPMFQFKDIALSTIRDNQVTILCGETGCGKSTQMPSFILEDELSHGRPCSIYCTEPRRISAISLAQRVSEEIGEGRNAVGTNRSLVGYAIRLESHTSASTKLVYATVGIVLRMLEGERGLTNVTHLIIDEVHERNIDTDFLLIVLRALLVRRSDLRVVLMSATVDAERFSRYLDNAPIITVPGRTFPVQTMYLEDALEVTGYIPENSGHISDDADDEIDEADGEKRSLPAQAVTGYSPKTVKVLASYDEYRIDYGLIVRLLESVAYDSSLQEFSKAVLVFLPGMAEIRRVNDMLSGHPSFSSGWHIYPLHSEFSSEDQQQAFVEPPPGIRKIVLATNIAETGITIPDVTCVIDTGKHKEMRFDERRQLSRLIQSFIAKSNAKQRRGRAGRVQKGLCFHLFTKARHDTIMADQQTPEILRLSLQDLVMRVKICRLGDIEHVLASALDPPSAKNIRRAIDALIEVNALTVGEELTPLGRQLAKLPLDARLGKMILLGSIFGCLDFALTTAAMSSSKTIFQSPIGAKKQAETVRLGFRRGDSDLLTAYNAYTAWRRVCTTTSHYEFQFCKKNCLSQQNLSNVEDLKGQLLSALTDAGFVSLDPDERSSLSRVRGGGNTRGGGGGGGGRLFVPIPTNNNSSDQNDTLINSVTAWSFYPNILSRDGKGWRNISNNASISLHPSSVNKNGGSPTLDAVRFMSFYSIMQSSARFTNAQETSPVIDMALVLLAGDATFNLYAGVVVLDGNRLRFKVRDWKTMVALQTLRRKMVEILGRIMKGSAASSAGAGAGLLLSGRQRAWWDIFMEIFERVNGTRARIAAGR